MAFKEFTIEGEAQMGFFSDEGNPRHIRIATDGTEFGERLEEVVGRALGFPTDDEFDEMSERNQQLRQDGLQPADDQPDILREGTRLRIRVEVVE